MLNRPPKEKQWVSWIYVVIWSLIIFVTIPLGLVLQEFVVQRAGSEIVTYAVIATIASAIVASAVYLRHVAASGKRYIWLLAVGAIFIGYTIKLGEIPVESIHFIQYGLLGVLIYRALTHRIRDISIYFSAAFIGGIVGMLDELIQWITPERFWGLNDIWINLFAASLVQVGIAKGLGPSLIFGWYGGKNLRFLCGLTMVAVFLLGVSMLNTPERISWYAERVTFLTFLKKNESVMVEYGYVFKDPDIGIFRSRFSPKELNEVDRTRAKEAAAILGNYQEGIKYRQFLKTYTSLSDPFVHEIVVHLFCRDSHLSSSTRYKEDMEKYAENLTVAYRENQILEKYFPHTLHHTSFVWSADTLSLAKRHLLRDKIYDSWVSRSVITRFKEGQVAVFFSFLLIVLALVHWYLRGGKSSHP
jgi:hypothetical protein